MHWQKREVVVIENYKQLLSKRRLNPSLFLIEIIEKLFCQIPEETPFGITELYESLAHPKPTFSSFRDKISALESADCIAVQPSREKASKKSVTLTENFRSQLEREISD